MKDLSFHSISENVPTVLKMGFVELTSLTNRGNLTTPKWSNTKLSQSSLQASASAARF